MLYPLSCPIRIALSVPIHRLVEFPDGTCFQYSNDSLLPTRVVLSRSALQSTPVLKSPRAFYSGHAASSRIVLLSYPIGAIFHVTSGESAGFFVGFPIGSKFKSGNRTLITVPFQGGAGGRDDEDDTTALIVGERVELVSYGPTNYPLEVEKAGDYPSSNPLTCECCGTDKSENRGGPRSFNAIVPNLVRGPQEYNWRNGLICPMCATVMAVGGNLGYNDRWNNRYVFDRERVSSMADRDGRLFCFPYHFERGQAFAHADGYSPSPNEPEPARPANRVAGWHAGPRPWIHSPIPRNALGVELEILASSDKAVKEIAEKAIELGLSPEHDGTLDARRGVEVVGPPIELAAYHGKDSKWVAFLKHIEKRTENLYKLAVGRGYGMHVSVNGTPLSSPVQGAIQAIVCNYPEFWTLFAGRNQNNWSCFLPKNGEAPSCDNDHYEAVNVRDLANTGRMEFRIFRTPRHISTFLKNVEMCDAIRAYCEATQDTDPHKWMEWALARAASCPNLCEWLLAPCVSDKALTRRDKLLALVLKAPEKKVSTKLTLGSQHRLTPQSHPDRGPEHQRFCHSLGQGGISRYLTFEDQAAGTGGFNVICTWDVDYQRFTFLRQDNGRTIVGNAGIHEVLTLGPPVRQGRRERGRRITIDESKFGELSEDFMTENPEPASSK